MLGSVFHDQGVSGSIVLRHGRLSDLIAQLQDLLKGAEGVESTPFKYDSALLAAQVLIVVAFFLYFGLT